MKNCKFLLLLLVAIAMTSCSEAVLNQKKTQFDNNRWPKNEPVTFAFDVETTGVYSFELFFSHVYGYQFPEIPLQLDIKYPDSHFETDRVMLQLKTADGKELGDCAGDYCDLKHLIQPPRALKPGHYEVKISHGFSGEYLPNVLAAGLKVSAKK